MIRKTIIVVLTLSAVTTAGLGIYTFFDLILWATPKDAGRQAYGIVVVRGDVTFNYWRFVARTRSKSGEVTVGPFAAYENDVRLGTTAYSLSWKT